VPIEPPAPVTVPPSVVEEVIVTAARLPPGAGEAAFSVVRIAPAETAQVRLDEVIGRAPGAGLFRRTSSLASNPTTQGISLRAIAPSGAGRALVTLDGVPQNDSFGGWVIWSQLPPETVEAVSVIRGAGSGPYGAGALTGVVALDERDEGAAADALLADRAGARLAGAAVAGRMFAAASYERSDGYVPVRGARAGAADNPTDLEAAAVTGRITLPLGRASVSLRANAYDEARGAGLVGARAEASGASASLTAAQAGPLGWRLQAWARRSAFSNTSVAVAPDRSATTPANDQYETPATGYGLNAALRRTRGGAEFELGVDARWSEGETRERFRYMASGFTRDRIAGGRAAVLGAYAEATRLDGPWLLTGGLRADRWSTADGRRLERDHATGAVTLDERPADRDGVVPTGRLGLRRRLGDDGLSLRAAAYAGFRPPTLNELHRPFRVGNDLTEANAALDPERLSGVELGLAADGSAWRWSLGLFANRLDDAVTNVTVGVGPGTFPLAGFVPAGGVLRQRRNAGVIEAAGLEAEAERRWGPFALRAAAAWTDARVDGGADAPQLTGKRPAQAPAFTATAGADWRPHPRLRLQADARWESARWEDDLNTRRLAAAAALDARAELLLRPGAALYLAADNLLDADVETGRTADDVAQLGPPRNLRFGLRLAR